MATTAAAMARKKTMRAPHARSLSVDAHSRKIEAREYASQLLAKLGSLVAIGKATGLSTTSISAALIGMSGEKVVKALLDHKLIASNNTESR